MPSDVSGALKTAIISHLEGDAALTAIVPVARMYGLQMPAVPEFPCIRYGSPISGSFDATCWEGSDVRVTIHAFAETGVGVSGENQALQIAALIVERMKSLDPSSLSIVDNEWIQTNIVRDEPDADRWHSFCEFRVTAIPA